MSQSVVERPKATLLFLSQEDVLKAGGKDIKRVLAAVETSFRLHGSGETVLPEKPVIRWGGPETEDTRGRIMSMPAYLGGSLDVAGIKWIASIPSNPRERNLPRGIGVIVLTDPHNGLPLAFMDGTLVSAMRTGAATGVAAKYLARRDSQVVGLIGAGVQARTQLAALASVLPALQQVNVFDLNRSKAEQFAEAMGELHKVGVMAVGSAREAIASADVFVTATVGTESYVRPEWLGPGVMQSEISFWDTPAETVAHFDRIVVDDWHQVSHHAVDVAFRAVANGIVPQSQIEELGPIVAGKNPGRTDDRQRILFNPIGLAIHDVSTAYHLYRRACELGIGRELELWRDPIWV
ncbi:MAG: ornithine cyclodeaminase family protein [Actinobacteria bacterium]|nr:ornithine cyclodeaminase family protein [Actinomycetota bacterium]